MMGKKIQWLAVLQGFSMLLVVIGHISLTNQPNDPNTPIATAIERTIYSFHMPLFMFISGWLYYYTCIGKNKPYKAVLRSKFKRLAIPFLSFTTVTMLLKLVFPQMMHRAVDVQEVVDTFVLYRSNPLGEMWFLVVLFELMLLYPVYQLIVKSKAAEVLGLAAAITANLFVPEYFTYFQLHRMAFMSPFFLTGILCCKHRWHKHLESKWALALATVLFLLCNVMAVLPKSLELLAILAGIAFAVSLCLLLARLMASLFSSFSEYTFQIFLMGIFFQMVIRWLFVKMGNELLFVPLWVLSALIGIYAPTLIAKVIERYAPRQVKACFGL